ncbi:hypothetical protein HMN09_01354600 [Mycena chlorophos]|uniref:Adenylate kinase n=1 Tax=Mycena chlorophos TaxID=658473 RepID=A0A8H6VPN5_MYCCL|nr:hypothetical protein HMN09_01354600 [Mycena chlorophos]
MFLLICSSRRWSSPSTMVPPLLGDGGVYRVHIVGNSGVGKVQSTTGRQLAEILGVPFISLDTLHWNPGWKKATDAEFRERVENALAAAPNGWVVDGNYMARLGDIVRARSTDIIWLDPPLLLYLPRLVLRTFLRAFGLQEDCSPGCPDLLSRAFFSKDSIIWWCISNHRRIRKRERALFARIGLGVGSDVEHQKMRRLGGWGSERRRWLEDVERRL